MRVTISSITSRPFRFDREVYRIFRSDSTYSVRKKPKKTPLATAPCLLRSGPYLPLASLQFNGLQVERASSTIQSIFSFFRLYSYNSASYPSTLLAWTLARENQQRVSALTIYRAAARIPSFVDIIVSKHPVPASRSISVRPSVQSRQNRVIYLLSYFLHLYQYSRPSTPGTFIRERKQLNPIFPNRSCTAAELSAFFRPRKRSSLSLLTSPFYTSCIFRFRPRQQLFYLPRALTFYQPWIFFLRTLGSLLSSFNLQGPIPRHLTAQASFS